MSLLYIFVPDFHCSCIQCNSKTIALIDLIFVHNNYYPRGSVLLKDDPDLDSRILFKNSSPLGDYYRYAKICHQSTPRRQMCVMMKTCVMTSHVRHSERGSVISDMPGSHRTCYINCLHLTHVLRCFTGGSSGCVLPSLHRLRTGTDRSPEGGLSTGKQSCPSQTGLSSQVYIN